MPKLMLWLKRLNASFWLSAIRTRTSEGFIDSVVKTRDYIYVIELKLNGTAEDAMRQIEEKHYASPFATDARRLYRLGLGFSKATGTVDSSLVE